MPSGVGDKPKPCFTYVYLMKHIHVMVADDDLGRVEQLLNDQKVEYEIERRPDGIPDWHKEILRERLANPDRGPLLSWEEIETRLANRRRATV